MEGKTLVSKRYEVAGFAEAVEFCYGKGWTDGLPVIPPEERRVVEFLDYAGLEPGQVVGEIPERGRVITAEKLAVNGVMAGCLPEYMPVLVAIIEAMTDPRFKFNHLASIGSPWPLIIVNGPIVKEIGLNSGAYLFGPGSRPNATIARAISLVLRNCAEAKFEGIQRGQWGHPGRWNGCIAENEDTAWTPLHVQLGFDRDSSTVTVVSTHPELPCCVATLTMVESPEEMLSPVCHAIAHHGGAMWHRGTYTVLLGPHHAEFLISKGWSKEDVRGYLLDNTWATLADLKNRGAWGVVSGEMTREMLQVHPADEGKRLYLFKDNGEHDAYLFSRAALEGRKADVFVVVAGGDAGHRIPFAFPYAASTNPVTMRIRSKEQ